MSKSIVGPCCNLTINRTGLVWLLHCLNVSGYCFTWLQEACDGNVISGLHRGVAPAPAEHERRLRCISRGREWLGVTGPPDSTTGDLHGVIGPFLMTLNACQRVYVQWQSFPFYTLLTWIFRQIQKLLPGYNKAYYYLLLPLL